MTTTAQDPVAAIPEADATGQVAEIFEDIRTTLGVPVVNLIWRHLATMPEGLAWAWTSLKPIYLGDELASQAGALNDALAMPALPGISKTTLNAIDLSAHDLETIRTVIASYERSNVRNLVTMGALLADLNDTDAPELPTTATHRNPERVTGTMPPLPAMQDMSPVVSALVNDMNEIGQRTTVMPTMYRHLSHWPAFLSQLHVLLAPLQHDGRLEEMIQTAASLGERRGAALRSRMGQTTNTLEPELKSKLRESIRLFVDEPIAKMTVIGGLVSRAMPG